MENIMKKSVAILALAALIIAVTCCFAFSLPLNAEESVVWDKIEIEPLQVGESSNTYNINLSEIRSEYRYVYIYVVGAGGAGGNGKKQAVGNGGGIIKNDGADANYGAGGGGAGYAAANGGKGGNGYVEVFGSNM